MTKKDTERLMASLRLELKDSAHHKEYVRKLIQAARAGIEGARKASALEKKARALARKISCLKRKSK